MKNYLVESMTSYMGKLEEARNPENDEVNAAIRRYLNSDKAYIPKKDRELFDKYGITPDKLSRRYGSQKIMKGPGGRDGAVIGADFDAMVHPDYDLANDLTKKKLDGLDIEQPTNDIKYYSDILGERPDTRTPKDTSKMSWNQFKSLQPYADEKDRIASRNADIRRAKQREAERIEQIKQDTQREIGYKQKEKDDTMRRAKLKHNTRNKNESLSLKEGLNYDDLTEILYWCEKMCDKVGWWSSSDPAGLFLDRIFPYLNETQIQYAISDIKDDANNEEMNESLSLKEDINAKWTQALLLKLLRKEIQETAENFPWDEGSRFKITNLEAHNDRLTLFASCENHKVSEKDKNAIKALEDCIINAFTDCGIKLSRDSITVRDLRDVGMTSRGDFCITLQF